MSYKNVEKRRKNVIFAVCKSKKLIKHKYKFLN